MTKIAREIFETSKKIGNGIHKVKITGRSRAIEDMLQKVQRFSRFREPILITGESGSGKEFVARSCHLLSPRGSFPFEILNCPQYREGNLTVSELFGHRKGSFTGAIRDRKGHFETADGGSIFFDEVADLHNSAQTTLLRALQENEFKPVGSEKTLKTDVRLIAATNRPLRDMIHSGDFREDLYFRLRYFPIEVPALRDRDDDWRYIAEFFLDCLAKEYGVKKSFSEAAIKELGSYHWPGNIRELKSIVTIGYSMAETDTIDVDHFSGELRRGDPDDTQIIPTYSKIYRRIVKENECFWEALYTKYMNRDINRQQATAVVRKGLIQTRGSYHGLLKLFNLPETDYQKFMDFLRHHDLKPKEPKKFNQ